MNILLLVGLAALYIALALLRPVDHDESQYVAAAVLTAHGLLPYRDFAYLQTPLQPFLLAPIAVLTGAWTWPALRLTNALLGLATVAFVHAAARAPAPAPPPRASAPPCSRPPTSCSSASALRATTRSPPPASPPRSG
ncbi:hypothetical protein QP185_10385 [Sphingomonas aerolata]|uniref:hypothetical protein n=1 Tax=Sphingomonas aerolata TaxID=185951 RepID=UPI002FE3C702